jgi:hypothetical protein
MKELFAASRMVAEDRSVNVTELSDRSIAIEGITVLPDRDVLRGAVRLSAEAMEEVRQLLNEWHECNKEA